MKGFERLFEPRTIVVVGDSDDPVRPASQTLHTLLRYGFTGRVYPVNPRYPTYEGMRCYPSVDAIEEEIDVVVIGVPARGVIPVIESCAIKRVPFAVVLSLAPARAVRRASSGRNACSRSRGTVNMRIVGPNCLGIANIHRDVYAAFGSMTRPPKLERGSLSLVTQSGGFGIKLRARVRKCGHRLPYLSSPRTGNEADITAVEFIDELLDDRKRERSSPISRA